MIADEIRHDRLLVESATPLASGARNNPNVLRPAFRAVIPDFRTSGLFGGGRGRSLEGLLWIFVTKAIPFKTAQRFLDLNILTPCPEV